MCIFLEGRMRITFSSLEDEIISYREIIPHDYFGWLSAIDGGPRLTAAIALEPSKAIVLKVEDFRKVILSDVHIHENFMKRVGGVLRRYTDRILELSLLSAHQRIIQELVRQFDENGNHLKILSHEDFATWTGTARETVTRTLNFLEKMALL